VSEAQNQLRERRKDMFTYVDAAYAQIRYQEMLEEAKRQRLITRLTAQQPSVMERMIATLRRGLAWMRGQNRPAQVPTIQRGLAAE
jgi:hypothetical protein